MRPSGSETELFAAAGAVRLLDYPEETTTRNGMLATIEAIAPGDEAQFFVGFVWPLGRTRIRACWAFSGAALGDERGFDIDPASSDVSAVIAKYRRC